MTVAEVSPKLREILVCPKCKGKLEYLPAAPVLRCHACHLEYAIEDGIPVMLIDEAKTFVPSK